VCSEKFQFSAKLVPIGHTFFFKQDSFCVCL